MTRRSRAREVALQLLYQFDLNPRTDRPAVERFVRGRLKDRAVEPFALGLYDGVMAHYADLDRRISEAARNWRLSRMAVVDRNVLRLAAFELLHTAEPPAAIINEAVELARRYGSADSPSFVNGLLDRLHRDRALKQKEEGQGPKEGAPGGPAPPPA